MAGTSREISDGGPGPSSSLISKSRFSWFIYFTKLKDTFTVHIGIKNTKGAVSEYSCSKPNATNKIPFDAPVKCEYIITKEAEESVGMMQFTSKRREIKKFRMSQLNCFEGGDNDFSRKVSSMVIDRREQLLGKFLCLLPYSKGFSLYREEVHSDEGELLDDIIDKDDFLCNDAVKNEYAEFRRAAMCCAKEVNRAKADIRQFFPNKRRADVSETGGSVPKKSIAAVIRDKERKELDDEEGLEKCYRKSFIGFANIPLDNISIAEELASNLISERVNVIAKSIMDKYDPSQAIPIICPKDSDVPFDIKRHTNSHKFVAVQKIHLVAALKKLDSQGEFVKLLEHKNRTLPCYVLRISDSGLIHYGNIRANNISSQFVRKTDPQDLVRTFFSLSTKDGAESAGKVVERMAGLTHINPRDCFALKKLCAWNNAGISALMEVISWYEHYESCDTKPKGYLQSLAQGKKLAMPHNLFRQLGKVDEDFFLANHSKVLRNEISLATLLKTYENTVKMNKVTAVLSRIADFKPYESLLLDHPGKFEYNQLKPFFGAEIRKDGSKNQEAVGLASYFESVVHAETENGVQEVRIVEYKELSALLKDDALKFYLSLVVNWNNEVQTDTEQVLNMLRNRLSMKAVGQVTMILFPSEESQCKVLSVLRSYGIADVKIKPIFFHDFEYRCGDFVENIRCGLLVGWFKVATPLLISYSSRSKVLDLVRLLSEVGTPVAVISGCPDLVIGLQNGDLQLDTTFFGTPEETSILKDVLTNAGLRWSSVNVPKETEFDNSLAKEVVDHGSNIVNKVEEDEFGVGVSGTTDVYDFDYTEHVKSVGEADSAPVSTLDLCHALV